MCQHCGVENGSTPAPEALSAEARIGGRVVAVMTALVGLVALMPLRGEPVMIVAVVVTTVATALWGVRVGRYVGVRVGGGQVPTGLVGSVGGLALLVGCAVIAAVVALVVGLAGGALSLGFVGLLRDYPGKTLLAVLFYGWWIAVPSGFLGAYVMRFFIARRRS